jgi:DNA primase
MTISDDFIAKVRARVPLAALVAETIALADENGSLRGSCPSHPDPSRGLYVNAGKDLFHCFSCGRHGDVVQWTRDRYRVSEEQAIALLAKRAGLSGPTSA